MDKTEYVYCLKSRYGFLSDSEWDGDSFCADPINSYHYDKPISDGRYGEQYKCVRIKIITHFNGSHKMSDVHPVLCHKNGIKKTRYKCKCNVCGASTKNYALPVNAIIAFNKIMETECVTKTWEYA